MKKIVWLLVAVMCVGLFASCGPTETAQERGDRLMKMTDADWAKASDADKKDAATVFVNTIKAVGFDTPDLTVEQVGKMLSNASGKSLNDLVADSVNQFNEQQQAPQEPDNEAEGDPEETE